MTRQREPNPDRRRLRPTPEEAANHTIQRFVFHPCGFGHHDLCPVWEAAWIDGTLRTAGAQCSCPCHQPKIQEQGPLDVQRSIFAPCQHGYHDLCPNHIIRHSMSGKSLHPKELECSCPCHQPSMKTQETTP